MILGDLSKGPLSVGFAEIVLACLLQKQATVIVNPVSCRLAAESAGSNKLCVNVVSFFFL
jgi:hypothetical protein